MVSGSRSWDDFNGWETVRSIASGRGSKPSRAISAGLSFFPIVTSVAHGKPLLRR